MRFSGKNSGNRVRFVRRVSTSVSAKSVLAVTEAMHVGAEPLRDVEAWLELALEVLRRRGDAAAGGHGRPNGQAASEIELR